MKVEALVEALRELQRRGWPVRVWGPRNGEYGAEVIYPDGGYAYPTHLLENGFQFQRDSDILTGFLVSQLEARGLRREVYWRRPISHPDAPLECRVSSRHLATAWHDEELSALIEFCLALPTETTHD